MQAFLDARNKAKEMTDGLEFLPTVDEENKGPENARTPTKSGNSPIGFDGEPPSSVPMTPDVVSTEGGGAATPLSMPNTVSSPGKFVKVKDEYKLADFRIKVKLGKGAFGNVYLVELDPSLNGAPNQEQPLVFAEERDAEPDGV